MVSKNLSVCPSVTNFDPNYLRIGWTEWAKKIQDIYGKMKVLKKFYLSKMWLAGPGPGPKKQHFDQISQLFGEGSGWNFIKRLKFEIEKKEKKIRRSRPRAERLIPTVGKQDIGNLSVCLSQFVPPQKMVKWIYLDLI